MYCETLVTQKMHAISKGHMMLRFPKLLLDHRYDQYIDLPLTWTILPFLMHSADAP